MTHHTKPPTDRAAPVRPDHAAMRIANPALADRILRRAFVEDPEDPDSCWPSQFPPTGAGYVNISVHCKKLHQHRVVYELAVGPIPAGLVVRHMCSNPLCIRPDHLAVGTHADNTADRLEQGRSGGAPQRLSARSVRAIRGLHAKLGTNHLVLAEAFGVTRQTIGNIINLKTRRRVAAQGTPA